jgi:hypothetical protein
LDKLGKVPVLDILDKPGMQGKVPVLGILDRLGR